MLHYDDILVNIVGEFGTYQKIALFLLGIGGTVPSALLVISPVFLLATTDSWCIVPDRYKISKRVCFNNITESCEDLVKHLIIPKETRNFGCKSVLVFDQCRRYNISYDSVTDYSEAYIDQYLNNTETMKCDLGWEYDTSQYKSTVSQEFDLVCDRFYLNALASSVYMLGMLGGSVILVIFFGQFGRMDQFMMSYILLIVTGILEAFSPNYVVFAVLRFFMAAGQYGIFISAFTLVSEYVGPTKRAITGMIYMAHLSVGYMILAGYAYFIRDWWILQLVIVVPCIMFLSYYWIIPESPRWLISVGRTEKAVETIKLFARVNKVTIPEDLFNQDLDSDDDIIHFHEKTYSGNQNNYCCADLLRYPNLRLKFLILCYNWAITSLVYYGISFDTSSLGGNAYLNVLFAGAVEIPAYISGMILMDVPRIGRRRSLLIAWGLVGVACSVLAFIPTCGGNYRVRLALVLLGKFGITCAFGMVRVYAAEIFPTPLRSEGLAMCSVCAYTGGILAPQLILMGELWKPLPKLIYGITSIIAGILVIYLPETRGKQLSETIEKAEQFGKKVKKHRVSSKTNDIEESRLLK
ncbi:organic cation transporter protein-like [Saccoglossus kowalevskii]